jgi:hypothetical protein
MLALGYQVGLYLARVFVTNHALLAGWYSLLIVGFGLVIASPVLAAGYHVIRRGYRLRESIKDYSLTIVLFVFGLFLIWLAFRLGGDLFVFVAGIVSILATFVSATFMRFVHL